MLYQLEKLLELNYIQSPSCIPVSWYGLYILPSSPSIEAIPTTITPFVYNLTNALTNDKITTVEKFMENSKYHFFVLLKNDYGGEYDKVQD